MTKLERNLGFRLRLGKWKIFHFFWQSLILNCSSRAEKEKEKAKSKKTSKGRQRRLRISSKEQQMYSLTLTHLKCYFSGNVVAELMMFPSSHLGLGFGWQHWRRTWHEQSLRYLRQTWFDVARSSIWTYCSWFGNCRRRRGKKWRLLRTFHEQYRLVNSPCGRLCSSILPVACVSGNQISRTKVMENPRRRRLRLRSKPD